MEVTGDTTTTTARSIHHICDMVPICTPTEYMVPWIHKSLPSNGISISLAVLAGLTVMNNTQTEWPKSVKKIKCKIQQMIPVL